MEVAIAIVLASLISGMFAMKSSEPMAPPPPIVTRVETETRTVIHERELVPVPHVETPEELEAKLQAIDNEFLKRQAEAERDAVLRYMNGGYPELER